MRIIRLMYGSIWMLLGGTVLLHSQTQHFQYTGNTGNNATVIVPITSNPNINGTPLESGDEIGAFTPGGLCVGGVVWTGFNTAMTVWGDNDQTGQMDGIQVGEVIQYRVWRQSTNTEFASVVVTYLQGGDGRYAVDGWYTVSTLRAIAPPAPPSLVAPVDGAAGVTVSPLFEWNASAYATSYQLQVASDAEFTSVAVDQSGLTTESYTASGLSYSTTYYWRVRASNSGGSSDFSEVRTFTTAAPPVPATPLLTAPANGAIDQPRTINVQWQTAANASSYHLQVSRDNAFSQLVAEQTGLTVTSTVVASLQPGTRYYWRVRGTNTGGSGAWSETWSFTTLPDAPGIPLLASPPDGSQNQPRTLQVGWSAVTGASWYRLQVSTSPSFASMVVDSPSITGTSKEIGPLTASTQYYWRVAAGNSGGISDWSDTWYFSTVPLPPPAPNLVSPADFSTNQPTTLILTWGAAARAESYHLQVSSDQSFTTMIVDNPSISGTSNQVSGLANSATLFWRVRASNAGGTSGWSSIWRFTTSAGLPPPPSTPTLSSPANGATNQQNPVMFSWNSSSGAAVYRLQVATNPELTALVANVSGLTSTNHSVDSLAQNTKHYWRVQAENQGGTSGWSSTWSLTTSVAPPNFPILLVPPNDAGNIPLDVTVRWSQVPGAQSYHLQVATREDFLILVYENSTIADTLHQPSGLRNSRVYYWRVRAMNTGGSSAWSSPSSFSTVRSAPPPPQLAMPADKARSQPVQPLLKWLPASGAVSYRLQVADNFAFTGTLETDTSIPDTSFQITDALEYSRTYYWRVNAANEGGTSPWSAIWTFETSPPPPPPPSLASPGDRSIDQPTALDLAWNGSATADSYHAQLSKSNSFGALVVDSAAITDTRLAVSGLEHETTYFWRVRSRNTAGNSAWSSSWQFTTLPSDARAPELVSPPNNATGVATNPTLSWNSVALATGYHLQVATNTDFSGIVADQNNISSTSYQVTGLQQGTTYFWRVRSLSLTGTSGWSTVWNFRTLVTTPGAPLLSLPRDGARDCATTLEMSWAAVPGATSYRIEISRTPAFTSSAIDSAGIPATEIFVSPLDYSVTYYWRVTAANEAGAGPPSVIRSFTTVTSSVTSEVSVSLSYPTTPNARPQDYRLVGLPGGAGAIVADLLTGRNGSNWRAYWDNGRPADYFVEIVEGSLYSFGNGRAFWLIHDGPISLTSEVLPCPLNSAGEAEIPLHAGWNIVTNPFSEPVPWSRIQTVNNLLDPLLRYQSSFVPSDTLAVFTGYYVFNSPGLQYLRIPAPSTGQSVASPAPQAAGADPDHWRIDVTLLSDDAEDNCFWFGIQPGASREYDPADVRKPRAVGSTPGMAFVRPSWDPDYESFASDVRDRVDELQVWDFEVSSPPRTNCSLLFRGLHRVPETMEIYLVDEARQVAVNLRQSPQYEFLALSDRTALRIAVGSPGAVQESLPSAVIPAHVWLGSNYPNPFNPTTVIPLSLPARARVNLSVYDALGQEVAALFDGSLDRGYYTFLWDGKDSAGRPAASGMYVIRLVAGGAQQIRKMILLK